MRNNAFYGRLLAAVRRTQRSAKWCSNGCGRPTINRGGVCTYCLDCAASGRTPGAYSPDPPEYRRVYRDPFCGVR